MEKTEYSDIIINAALIIGLWGLLIVAVLVLIAIILKANGL